MARLDEPLLINGMRLRNRLALPPITTGYGSPEGEVTPRMLAYYRQRAKDVGMVVVEATAVRSDGRLVPSSLGLWSDAQIQGMASLVRALQEEGAAAVVQIVHGGARSVPVEGGIYRVSPSGVQLNPGSQPTVLEEDQIAQLARDFAGATVRAAEAGFDGVEVHGAHLYLISQFLSPLTNHRQDRYGGDALGRATFAVEVVRAIRERVGRAYPVLFRLNAVELVEGGQSLAESAAVARLLESAGVDAIHSSLVAQARWREGEGGRYLQASSALSKDRPRGDAVPYAAHLKAVLGIPVVAVGKLGDPVEASRVVGHGLADVVAVGRQMIADPASAGKILRGKAEEIVQCQECLTCYATIQRGLICSVNRDLVGPATYRASGS